MISTRAPGAVPSGTAEAWRVVAGASAAILVSTAAIGVITFSGAGDHLPWRVRFDNVAGGGLLVLLVAVPACIFGLWPVDAATHRLSRTMKAAVFALIGVVTGAVAGAGFAAVRGDPVDGALLGACLGILGGIAAFVGVTWISRSRTVSVALAVVTLAVVVYGTWQLQTF